jgi:hypothetical protein
MGNGMGRWIAVAVLSLLVVVLAVVPVPSVLLLLAALPLVLGSVSSQAVSAMGWGARRNRPSR